jgi:preprotein translocase subunit SecG
MGIFLLILILLTGIVLIFIILIQRGRGGGLVGALGGQGGASAFGTRAGDTFTRITIGVALLWIVLNMGMNLYSQSDAPKGRGSREPTPAAPQATMPTQPN